MPRTVLTSIYLLAFALASPAMAQSHAHGVGGAVPDRVPREGGQGAFAAMGEIVSLLRADPSTNWQAVNFTKLREHLVDMDAVALRARVATQEIMGGLRFDVAGDTQADRAAIRRILIAHARMARDQPWRVEAAETGEGAWLTVTSQDPLVQQQIRGLGFFGTLTAGAHHQQHHLMMASGAMSH